MSYVTDLRGEIWATPPITWAELRSSGGNDSGRGFSKTHHNGTRNALAISVHVSKEDTEHGVLEIRSGDHIEGIDDARGGRGGETAKVELQEILDRYARADRTFSGTIEGAGEDSLDVWRLRAVQGPAGHYQAVVDLPTITWPED